MANMECTQAGLHPTSVWPAVCVKNTPTTTSGMALGAIQATSCKSPRWPAGMRRHMHGWSGARRRLREVSAGACGCWPLIGHTGCLRKATPETPARCTLTMRSSTTYGSLHRTSLVAFLPSARHRDVAVPTGRALLLDESTSESRLQVTDGQAGILPRQYTSVVNGSKRSHRNLRMWKALLDLEMRLGDFLLHPHGVGDSRHGTRMWHASRHTTEPCVLNSHPCRCSISTLQEL